MFKIGDFSKLSRVSIKALHLYDRIGLLKPIQVDQFTSDRYYYASQLTNEIQANPDRIVGSYREFYIQGGDEQDNESYITEVQFPVAKFTAS